LNIAAPPSEDLEDVLYSKEASENLIFVKCLQADEISFEFNKDGLIIFQHGVVVAKNAGTLQNIPIIEYQSYTVNVQNKDSFRSWHERFGHISNAKLLEKIKITCSAIIVFLVIYNCLNHLPQ